MLTAVVHKIFGSKNERELKRLWPMVEQVNSLEPKFAAMSDAELQAQTGLFRERLDRSEPLNDLLPEAFAVVREAAKRTLGMRHFDVQLIGGAVLHEGKIAEMKTGEGKTLCATLPVYLNALPGKGVHVVTVNDYLARRDAEWMGSIYGFLGLTTGVVVNQMDAGERYRAYRSDITYGQNNEFGFDYLRDNMKQEMSEMVQRGHYFAIVDEVDSILIDEARTPLIISGPSEEATDKYRIADQVVRQLREEEHYTSDLKSKQVMVTEEGVRFLEGVLGVENLYEPTNIEMVHHVNQALHAHVSKKRDIDYVVRNGQVIIVDEFTGRLMPGRRWSDGLHQAIEAKEGVEVARENQTLATITFQNYFRMYGKLAGMTGTADTEAVEFKKIYNLDVVIIPTNKPMIRKDYPDVVFKSEHGKYREVCKEIAELVERGQPVLVGTASIARSEILSSELNKARIKHHVLNAKAHEREAEIVAQAGRFGAVTISTNMAGRGTDIVLGGNPEFLAYAAAGTRDPHDAEYQAQLEHFRELCAREREQVLEAGGLHILGTERHESRRIDNQLRGRSGRQGDPGSSRFYVSFEDDLMKRFGGDRAHAMMTRMGVGDDDAIEGSFVSKIIENAQKKVEGHHFDIRKHLLEYDDVMNKHREVIYTQRAKILRGEGIEEEIVSMIPDLVEDLILTRADERQPVDNWDVKGMFAEFGRQFGMALDPAPFIERQAKADRSLAQELFEYLNAQALARYEERKARFGPEQTLKLERIILLQAIDNYWKEHLAQIDHLKEGIGLRGYGQKNPLYEYQREAFELFSGMLLAVKSSVVQAMFMLELVSEDELRALEEREREMLRRREAAAKEVHEDVIEGGVKEDPATVEGSNRQARRRHQQAAKPHTEQVTQQARAKEAARKKNKEARKARKKGR